MRFLPAVLAVALAGCANSTRDPANRPTDVEFIPSAQEVEAYDFLEVAIRVKVPAAKNPFTEADVRGTFRRPGGEPVTVDGFSDSPAGRLYKIRFMPSQPGDYAYTVTFREGDRERAHSGSFRARDGKRRGMVRADREHPFHFVWEGTGEHYFWNGTTTYGILGWQDDKVIREAIDRLHALKVNRMRVTLTWRVKDGRAWFENVFPGGRYKMAFGPWVAERPDDTEKPGYDVSRFDVSHWQKVERLLRHAREKDMVVSVIFYTDGRRPGTDPFGKGGMGGEDEQRYYRYAAARLAPFSNIMWDVANEYRLFRNDAWAEKMGAFLKECDPYDHLTSVHGHGDFRFMKSPWADFAMYQSWDEKGGNAFLLKARQNQAATGRPLPQVNEEYGYEDHYPKGWGGNRVAPARSADNRRRLAWAMYMAGGYQTTGERADTGTHWGPDTGGGWINGRGDDSMVMFKGYGRIVDFFTGFEWWKTEPRNDLVSEGALCLAELGKCYAVYLPSGGRTTLKLVPGTYRVERFDPGTGERRAIDPAAGTEWTAPETPAGEDRVFLLRRSGG